MIGDLEKVIQGMRNTAIQHGTTLQPFPLVVGPTLAKINSSYLVIDGTQILVESPLRALEITFKTYHALYCNYPIQSERLWVVLEKTLFKIDEDWETEALNNAEILRLIDVLKV